MSDSVFCCLIIFFTLPSCSCFIKNYNPSAHKKGHHLRFIKNYFATFISNDYVTAQYPIKNAPDRIIFSVKGEQIQYSTRWSAVPPCFTGNPAHFDEIPSYLRQLTYAQRRRILGSTIAAFDCALRGPFNNLRLIRLPPARTLWTCTTIFISTSSVYTDIQFSFQ